MKHKRRRLV